jgi:hypothetical protein
MFWDTSDRDQRGTVSLAGIPGVTTPRGAGVRVLYEARACRRAASRSGSALPTASALTDWVYADFNLTLGYTPSPAAPTS